MTQDVYLHMLQRN